jgi:hypothetical protein
MLLRPRSIARPLFAGLLLAAATVGSAFAQAGPPVVVEGSPGFDPYQGEVWSEQSSTCSRSQSE